MSDVLSRLALSLSLSLSLFLSHSLFSCQSKRKDRSKQQTSSGHVFDWCFFAPPHTLPSLPPPPPPPPPHLSLLLYISHCDNKQAVDDQFLSILLEKLYIPKFDCRWLSIWSDGWRGRLVFFYSGYCTIYSLWLFLLQVLTGPWNSLAPYICIWMTKFAVLLLQLRVIDKTTAIERTLFRVEWMAKRCSRCVLRTSG